MHRMWRLFFSSSCLLIAAFLLPLLLPGPALATPPWPHPYWDIPGDYCRGRFPARRCCQGRQDRCSVPILGTLCYCDTFCNRTDNSDCCPDYFTHCGGMVRPEKGEEKEEEEKGDDGDGPQYAEHRPEEQVFPGDQECPQGRVRQEDNDSRCFLDGKAYTTRDVVKKNCNSCKCQVSLRNPNCMDLLCDSEACLVDPKVVEEIRRGQYSWTPASNYTFLWGRTLRQGLRGRLGTSRPEEPVRDMTAMKYRYSPGDIPPSFDARDKWPGKIQGIRDQGWCGASWAFSTTAVAADRFAIEGESTESMSAQSLISCNTEGQSGCRGGFVDRAWNFLRRFGTVPESCYPFANQDGYGDSFEEEEEDESANRVASDPASGCRVARTHQADMVRAMAGSCPQLVKRKQLFRTQPAYRVGRRNTADRPKRRQHDIMFEIMTHGPVQASMEVKSDFFMYKSGVYRATNLAESGVAEFHSVRIVGWGEEEGEPYWLCANSWGREWGEDGFFKIARGSNEGQIEDFVVGVWARTKDYSRKMLEKRKNRIRQRRRRHHRRHRRHRGRHHRRHHGGNNDVARHYQVG